jgi:ribosomal protein S1
MAEIYNLNQQFTGGKKTFYTDPWPDIYASRQNHNSFLTGIVSAIETHDLKNSEGEVTRKIPCAVVMMTPAKGLIPLEESGCTNRAQLKKLVGQLVTFKVITLDESENLFFGSIKRANEYLSARAWNRLKAGEIRTAVVREVNLRGAQVEIDGIVTELPAQEMSWGWINDLREIVQVGDAFDVKIMEVDKENKKLRVSLRELMPSPWPGVMKRYKTGKDNEYMGTVTGLPYYGIFVNLEPGVDALVKQRDSKKRPALGEKVRIVITKMDPDKKQIEGYITRRLGHR